MKSKKPENKSRKAMFFKLLILASLSVIETISATPKDQSFIFNGFRSPNLTLDGSAGYTPTGLLQLTNTSTYQKGHAFYPNPISFKNSSINTSPSTTFSFSTTFVFAIVPEYPKVSAHGMAFVLAPSLNSFQGAQEREFLGLFNKSNNGNDTNHIVAVELDTIQNAEFEDINDNHVGIDINGLKSVESKPAGYYYYEDESEKFANLSLVSGHAMQIWVEYNGTEKVISVTLAPINLGKKPEKPLLSVSCDLFPIVNDTMFVGFLATVGSVRNSYYVLGWSFKMNGVAEELSLWKLPKLPKLPQRGPKPTSRLLTIGLPLVSIVFVSLLVSGVVYVVRRKMKFAEELEDWELNYGPHRFKFKDLYIATGGFTDKELLGRGGFGRVYRGVLPSSKIEIAVKRISHESRQGMREFVAEIVSIGRMRHRNLVTLLGYCRRKGELLLVYDYMPNGSLDKYLYDQPKLTLNWRQRFRVLKGVASGLFYLHQEWEQVVIHRDVKASNVLLDGELNGRLGDFGLARLYDHGTDPQTTHVVGTLGYLAPEHTRTGKATTSTDVFAFGAFLLEICCGRRPIEPRRETENLILVDYVFSCWSGGDILRACDPNLGGDYAAEEMELVLKLGLLCSHSESSARPSMWEILRYLEGELSLPNLSRLGLSVNGVMYASREGFDDFAMFYPSSIEKAFTHLSGTAFSHSSSVAESLLSEEH